MHATYPVLASTTAGDGRHYGVALCLMPGTGTLTERETVAQTDAAASPSPAQ